MRRLRALYIIFWAAFFYACGLLYLKGRISYSSLSLAFLAMVPVGYLGSRALSYIMIAASWAVFLPVLIIVCRIRLPEAITLIVLADLLLAAFVRGKRIIEDTMKVWHANLRQKEEERKSYAAQVAKTEAVESEIKAKELMIANLYEITRKMSESLTFDDIFDALSVFLKGNFDFRKCELVIFKQQVGGLVVDRKYGVLTEEKGVKSAEDSLDYTALAWFLSQHPGGAYLEREDGADEMRTL
ncbi:MAG: hypothetical protein JW919_02865, partial [Candidatus Omnitrophica bacterium]|nr:hypothetical protein [Candidatus Omnitrophota bacterium]